jgi:hypothetical protein
LSKPSLHGKGAEIGDFIADIIRQINRAVGVFLAARPSISSFLASCRSSRNCWRDNIAFALRRLGKDKRIPQFAFCQVH